MSKERFKLISAVHLLLIKDEKVLLSRRFNTGYEDGNYSVPAGHIDGRETLIDAMIREAKEEVGIIVHPQDVQFAHVVHYLSGDERLQFFFKATIWQGEIANIEPHKCDELRWVSIDNLPGNTVPYVKQAIECYINNISYSEWGWDKKLYEPEGGNVSTF